MNPRQRQFALAGSLSGWTRLDPPTSTQERVLRRTYRGLEPRVYSRYGVRQWMAPRPWSHTIVQDPFALLSVPAIVRVTGAVPVVLYRPCGAVLTSYRRMGWTADVTELRAVTGGASDAAPADDVDAMIEFWTTMHRTVLDWLSDVPETVLVSHAEVANGGAHAVKRVMRACGLDPAERDRGGAARAAEPQPGRLHDFARAPAEVTEGWRTRLDPADAARVEDGTAEVLRALDDRRLRVT
jgi:hypothetical protein